MPQPRRKTQNTLPGVKGRQGPRQTPLATPPDAFTSRLVRVNNVMDAMERMSQPAATLMVWMIDNGVMEQKDEPFMTFMSVKDLSADTGVPAQELVDAIEEMGDYIAPANDHMYMRVVTILGMVVGDDGVPEMAIIYIVPVKRTESRFDAGN